jgi:hypothetical protein
VCRGCGLLVEDDLRDSLAVAEVEEGERAEVASARHPAHQQHFASGVLGAQRAARVRALKVSEVIECDFSFHAGTVLTL